MTVQQDVLKKAAEFIEAFGWTQGTMARTEMGNSCGPNCALATCFCTVGAIKRAIFLLAGNSPEVFHRAIGLFCDAVETNNVPRWNDTPGRTKEEVIDALRRAAAPKADVGGEA